MEPASSLDARDARAASTYSRTASAGDRPQEQAGADERGSSLSRSRCALRVPSAELRRSGSLNAPGTQPWSTGGAPAQQQLKQSPGGSSSRPGTSRLASGSTGAQAGGFLSAGGGAALYRPASSHAASPTRERCWLICAAALRAARPWRWGLQGTRAFLNAGHAGCARCTAPHHTALCVALAGSGSLQHHRSQSPAAIGYDAGRPSTAAGSSMARQHASAVAAYLSRPMSSGSLGTSTQQHELHQQHQLLSTRLSSGAAVRPTHMHTPACTRTRSPRGSLHTHTRRARLWRRATATPPAPST